MCICRRLQHKKLQGYANWRMQKQLEKAIYDTPFIMPLCPVYQNVNALPSTDPAELQANLVKQLTEPVRWTQSVQAMVSGGATLFTECGPGKVLEGLIKKIAPDTQLQEI